MNKELKVIENLEGIKLKSPGVFYFKAIPFLHFHDSEGKRWADIKDPNGEWISNTIDFDSNNKERAQFLKLTIRAHAKFLDLKKRNSKK